MTTTVQICSDPRINAIVGDDGATDYEVTITLSHTDVERHLKTFKGGMNFSDSFAIDVLRATIEQGLQEQLTRYGKTYLDLYGEADGIEELDDEVTTAADLLKWIEEQKRVFG